MGDAQSISRRDGDNVGESPDGMKVIIEHPDNCAAIDLLDDPVTSIATELSALGPVVTGHGVGNPKGSEIQFGNFVMPNIFVPAEFCSDVVYGVVSWDAVRAVYLNPDIYSSRFFEKFFGDFWGPTLTVLDPPEHSKYRAVMQIGFTPKRIKSYESALIKPVLSRRFAELKPRGRADLTCELTAFYPYEIVGGIVGFDPSDLAFVADCFARTFQANTDPSGAAEAGEDLKAYARKLVATRRVEPRDDLISAMIKTEVDGKPIDDEHVAGLAIHLISGGIDTTHRQSSIITNLLLEHPDQLALLRKDRTLIPKFIEEVLRYEGIGNIFARQAIKDTNLLGTPIQKGSIVFLLNGIANRDPSRWSNPNVLDVLRDQKPHIQFAGGAHICMGQHLARLMLLNFTRHLLDDLPNLRWDPSRPRPKITGWSQRASLNLPVIWDVA